jgi:hypothetical protein
MYFLSINGTDCGKPFIGDKTPCTADIVLRNPTKDSQRCADE